MTALLRKDLYVADKQMRLVVVLALVFSVIPQMETFGATYALVLAFLLPISTITYDEKCRWDRYAAMLPYRPGQIVGSKYVLSLLSMVFAAAVILLGRAAQGLISGQAPDWPGALELMSALAAMVLIMTDLGIPLSYRFGVEKGRVVQMTLLIATAALVGGWFTIAGEEELMALLASLIALPAPLLIGGGAVLVAALTALSYRASVRFYRNRRSGLYN